MTILKKISLIKKQLRKKKPNFFKLGKNYFLLLSAREIYYLRSNPRFIPVFNIPKYRSQIIEGEVGSYLGIIILNETYLTKKYG